MEHLQDVRKTSFNIYKEQGSSWIPKSAPIYTVLHSCHSWDAYCVNWCEYEPKVNWKGCTVATTDFQEIIAAVSWACKLSWLQKIHYRGFIIADSPRHQSWIPQTAYRCQLKVSLDTDVSKQEQCYCATKQELLPVVFFLQDFRSYLFRQAISACSTLIIVPLLGWTIAEN